MISYFVFEVTHSAPIRSQMIGTATLVQVIMQSTLPPDGTDLGGWVGRPRVTRRGSIIGGDFQTTLVALYAIPDGTSARRTVAILQAVKDRETALLGRIVPATGSWGDVSVVRWSEPTNGPVVWWENGGAARTTTEEDPPVLSTDAYENPRGPTGADTHPTTPAETLEHLASTAGAAASQTTDLLWAATAFAAALLAIYGANEWRKRSATAGAPRAVDGPPERAQSSASRSRLARAARLLRPA